MMQQERFRLYNKLCDSCTRYEDCSKKNACNKCKKLDICDKLKDYSDEYYNIFEHEAGEEILTKEELKNIFTHDYDPKLCSHFDCTDYEMSDEQMKSEKEDEMYDRIKYLKNFR